MRLSMRPANGWRAFAGEVGVIVLGVVIALAAQQAAETVNERLEAAETHRTLANEISEMLAVFEIRRAAQPCIDNRLKELRAIVDEWGGTGSFETPRWVSQPTWLGVETTRFDAAESAGRLALLSGEEQYQLGQVIGSLRNFGAIQLDEMDAWARLRMLQSGAGALSETDRTAIRVALQQAALLNYRARIIVGQTLPLAAEHGWRSDRRRVRQLMSLAWKDGRFRPSVCLSIDTPAEQANREANLIYELPE